MARKRKTIRKPLRYVVIILTMIVFVIAFLLIKAAFSRKTVKEEPAAENRETACTIKIHEKVYLAVGERYQLDDTNYTSADPAIASINGDILTGNQVGVVMLSDQCGSYEIEVSDMITVPYVDFDKEMLPCEYYTIAENEKLDEILAGKVKEKGYQTRAGAVEAARFLLLQFPFHMDYFSENGRYPYVDGEGRYYHEGLYLNVYKSEDFTSIIEGPLPWGCPMFSIPGNCYQPNSLDCSGFVTWCLVNGGFDPGDLGAGPDPETFDMTDLGDHHVITEKSLENVKVGDLFSADGHISILIGKKDGIFYIAESDLPIDVRVRVTTVEELCDCDFTFWIDMDEFYAYQEGKLTDYWME